MREELASKAGVAITAAAQRVVTSLGLRMKLLFARNS